MTTVEEIARSGSGLRQLQLLSRLVGLERSSDDQVDIEVWEREPERFGFTSSSLGGDLERLKGLGWIDFWETYGGVGSVVLNQAGFDAAEEFTQLQSDAARRSKAARDGVLRWLYDAYVSGASPAGTEDFMSSSECSYLGSPFSEGEVSRAVDWLYEKGFVRGTRAWGGAVLRPSITAEGIDMIETSQSAGAALAQAGMSVTNINVTGSHGVNLAVASHHVHQSNTLTRNQLDEVAKVIDSAKALLTSTSMGVSEETEAEARGVVSQLEAEIEEESPRAGIVKALVGKLTELAASGTVQWAVDALTALAQQAIGSM